MKKLLNEVEEMYSVAGKNQVRTHKSSIYHIALTLASPDNLNLNNSTDCSILCMNYVTISLL